MSEEGGIKLSKTMLIIKSDANSLKGVEQFLRNREWNLRSTSQLKEAILFLVQHKPTFVLISVDHPNKKMQKLPKIVASAFPACVMVYAEKTSAVSFKALLDSGAEYKINPPVTGPAIERAVNKYIRDQEQASRQKESGSAVGQDKSSFEFQVEIKSSSNKEAGFVSMTAESKASGVDEASSGHISLGLDSQSSSVAQSLLAQLGLGDEDSTSGEMNGLEHTGAGLDTVAGVLSGQQGSPNPKFHKTKEGQIINVPLNSKDPGESGFLGNIGAQKKRVPKTIYTDSSLERPHSEISIDPKGFKKSGDLDEALSRGKRGKDILIGRAQKKHENGYQPEEDEKAAKELYVPATQKKNSQNLPDQQNSGPGREGSFYDPTSAGSLGGRLDPSGASSGAKTSFQNQDQLHIHKQGSFHEDSIFVRGVSKTIDESVEKGSGLIEQRLEDNTHLACIVVESPKFSGYLVAALGKDKRIDDEFVSLVRARLMKFLRDNGEIVDKDEGLQIKVRRVDFEGWALEYAQFLRKSVHKGDEVAMAFFPFADAQTKVGESAIETMVSIRTDEVKTDVPLEFNLYVYLPTNKKYVLYTPQNGKFLDEQRQRLMRQGVQNLHIKKDDVQNLSRFKAQNHLNSLIEQYDDVDRPKKKAA